MTRKSGQAPRSLYATEAREAPVLCDLHFLAAVLIVVGFFGPWVAHKTAALSVTGYELSEFAKFFPQVQSGSVPVRRALFATPLLAGVVSLSLIMNRSSKAAWWRFAATSFLLLLAAAALPPLQAILAPQYRLQLILVAVGILLTGGAGLTRRLSERSHGALLAVLAAAGGAPALWEAQLLYPLVLELYGNGVRPGWGMLVCLAGLLLHLLIGLSRVLRP